jgi:hypothetical protein
MRRSMLVVTIRALFMNVTEIASLCASGSSDSETGKPRDEMGKIIARSMPGEKV